MRARRLLVDFLLFAGLAGACGAQTPALTQASVDAAVAASVAALSKGGPKDPAPPMAVMWLQWVARGSQDAKLAALCADLVKRADATLDRSPAAQGLRVVLLLNQGQAGDEAAKKRAGELARTLADRKPEPGAANLGSESIIIMALCGAGALLDSPDWIATAEASARQILAQNDPATGKPYYLATRGVRQEAYGLATMAVATLRALGRPLDDLLAGMRTTMKAAYGAADGSYLAEPGGNPSVRDGRALSGNASAAVALLNLAETKVDPAALAEAKALLVATLPLAKPAPEYAGLWLAAGRYLKLAPPPAPANASREVSLSAALAEPVKPGEDAVINVTLTMNDPWHIYANKPGSEAVIPTEVVPTLPAGCAVKSIVYPDGKLVTAAGEQVMVYAETVTIKLTISTPANLPAGAKAALSVRLQACDDNSCLRPTKMSMDVPLR
ncbi:MAG: hypothetical protein HZB16_19775 [Armatimonadetes bacterium]|nr:hypothetical protein [Armatimonadota bacterium]